MLYVMQYNFHIMLIKLPILGYVHDLSTETDGVEKTTNTLLIKLLVIIKMLENEVLRRVDYFPFS
jgi:hypothetical protein